MLSAGRTLVSFSRARIWHNDVLQCIAGLLLAIVGPPDEEYTSDEMLRFLQPDLYVKGGDYTNDEIPETASIREIGRHVVILPLVGGTTATDKG
jgi:bifunctional ADP-heptose synthase (sugar kinase/adenylyltransferase)